MAGEPELARPVQRRGRDRLRRSLFIVVHLLVLCGPITGPVKRARPKAPRYLLRLLRMVAEMAALWASLSAFFVFIVTRPEQSRSIWRSCGLAARSPRLQKERQKATRYSLRVLRAASRLAAACTARM